jgi:hypothetical protein
LEPVFQKPALPGFGQRLQAVMINIGTGVLPLKKKVCAAGVELLGPEEGFF